MAYKGGKGQDGVYHRIINQIPPHRKYIELFLGGGSIMVHKKPAIENVGIDLSVDALEELRLWSYTSLPGGIFINGDAISYLVQELVLGHLGPDVFVYADPPYLKKDIDGSPVRSWQGDIYKHEFDTVEQHQMLLDVLKVLPCMVAVSGYWSQLYERELVGWRSIKYQVGVQGGQARTEWLWMNYAEPQALHDYRYLGENFREREKITRQKKRWRMRLQRMSSLQRYALLSSIAELSEPAGKS